MTTAATTESRHLLSVEHGDLWLEEEYLELGETPDRIELFDGSLFVSPSAKPIHQRLSLSLAMTTRPWARAVGLDVYQDVNVRLKVGRILIPDLVILDQIDPEELVVEASSVRLVCEITSPSNAATDRVLKMHHYAEAGIAWYLLVEPKPTVTLRLFRLEGDRYLLAGEGRAGQPLHLTDPITLDLDPATLDRVSEEIRIGARCADRRGVGRHHRCTHVPPSGGAGPAGRVNQPVDRLLPPRIRPPRWPPDPAGPRRLARLRTTPLALPPSVIVVSVRRQRGAGHHWLGVRLVANPPPPGRRRRGRRDRCRCSWSACDGRAAAGPGWAGRSA